MGGIPAGLTHEMDGEDALHVFVAAARLLAPPSEADDHITGR